MSVAADWRERRNNTHQQHQKHTNNTHPETATHAQHHKHNHHHHHTTHNVAFYTVVHKPFVFVRQGPSTKTKALGYKWHQDRVPLLTNHSLQNEQGTWHKLDGHDGWMLLDGTMLGLGPLLQPCDPLARLVAASDKPSATPAEMLLRTLFEQKYPSSAPRPDARLPTDEPSLLESSRAGLAKVHAAYDRAHLPLEMRTATRPAAFSAARVVDTVDALEVDAHSALAAAVARNEPLLLRGAAATFEPLRAWSSEQLRARVGARPVPVRINPRAATHRGRVFGDVGRMDTYERGEVRLDALLDELEQSVEPRYYAARLVLREVLPELLSDLEAGPADVLGSLFGEGMEINPVCNLGGGRQATPLHFDPSENLLCVVHGAKELSLYHPSDSEHLYPAGERNSTVVYSRADPYASDAELASKWPLLARASEWRAEVRAGDVLYLPCGWWHAVRGSAALNLSLNWWFELAAHKGDGGAARAAALEGQLARARAAQAAS